MTDQIATLGITVSADGAIRQVDRLDQSLNKLGVTSVSQTRNMGAMNALHAEAVGHIGAHSLSYGRLENSVASFIGHAVGVPPVIEKISVAMGHFAIGSVELTGILVGMAAIVGAYNFITKGAREAREEQDKLVQSLRSANDESRKGPESKLNKQFRAEQNTYNTLVGRRDLLQTYGARDDDKRIIDLNAKIAESYKNLQEFSTRQVSATPLSTVTTHADLSGARRAEEAALAASRKYWEGEAQLIKGAREALGDLYNSAREYLRDNPSAKLVNGLIQGDIDKYTQTVNGSFTGSPSISISDGLTKEQIRTREKMGILVDDANKNADKLSAVIWGSAAMGANAIVSALNIGGGGRGSGLGGALGSTAGFAIGYATGGPVGGAIGGTIGNIFGSLVGGLFDHKKAVDQNTAQLRTLNALLSNAPSGYKVNGARYRADDGRNVYNAAQTESYNRKLRGGVGNMGIAA